jgi:hypothetical protein
MKAKNLYVFDTNILISSFIFPGSKPGLALKKAFKQGLVLISSETYQELVNVLMRDKFDRYLDVESRIETLAGFLRVAQCRGQTSSHLFQRPQRR